MRWGWVPKIVSGFEFRVCFNDVALSGVERRIVHGSVFDFAQTDNWLSPRVPSAIGSKVESRVSGFKFKV